MTPARGSCRGARGACGRATVRPRSPSPHATRARSVIWQDVECGAYSADLELWEELGAERGRRVLELGCGTGRVGLWLARRGHRVVGLDRDPQLVEEFNRRAGGLVADAQLGDAADFSLDAVFDLVLAPMQLVQLLAGAEERIGCFGCVAGHLRPGGLLATAVVEGLPVDFVGEAAPVLPDTREVDDWVYSSLPLETVLDGERIVVRRLRQTVAPGGELSEQTSQVDLRVLTAAGLEADAVAAGLRPAGRREIPATEAHVGSAVVLLEKAI